VIRRILDWWSLLDKGGLEFCLQVGGQSTFPWVWVHLDITPYKD
jgi:hypothetical protein